MFNYRDPLYHRPPTLAEYAMVKKELEVMSKITVNIEGIDVSITELIADVKAAKAKGLSGEFAFTPETVEALIEKIQLLTMEKNLITWEFCRKNFAERIKRKNKKEENEL